jgi:hypothetical protein
MSNSIRGSILTSGSSRIKSGTSRHRRVSALKEGILTKSLTKMRHSGSQCRYPPQVSPRAQEATGFDFELPQIRRGSEPTTPEFALETPQLTVEDDVYQIHPLENRRSACSPRREGGLDPGSRYKLIFSSDWTCFC